MNTWLENNFLEKLSAHSAKESPLPLCPEAETLSLQSDLQSFESTSQKLAAHIKQCPTCLDIQNRLLQFDQFADLDLPGDSAESEKRLDSWFKGFLAAQTIHTIPAAVPAQQSPNANPVIPISKSRSSSIAPWALAAAALILLAIATFQLRNKLHPAISPSQTAQNAPGTPAAEAPKPLVKPDSPTASPITSNSSLPKTPNSPRPSAPKLNPAPTSEEPPVQSAASNPVSAPTLPTLPAVLSPKSTAPKSSSSNNPTRPSAANTESARAIDPALRPNLPNAQPHPALAPIHLPSGVRIWLTLNSVANQPDGRFLFKATLLLDTVDSGKVLLAKGALIEGSGQKIGNQTSLRLTRILSHGQYFRLASPAGSLYNAPGSGKTVSFKSGQVLEMWLNSATIFEPVENSHPQN